ncbi:hypothetical protein CDAR_299723 [Caerostris darwini]|uniref:Ankyrin repeat protein n=1 Tax=Caerostris darwini TaxID=1538125 RepID=A0AAV4NF31_9ARAC|nr:hypothetical protein CDAR_299723 [Caerostris darwini]
MGYCWVLEDNSVNIVDNEKTALYIACERASVPYIKLLLQMNSDVNVVDNEKTALYIACERASVPYIKLLLEMNSDVNASTSRGTALHTACLEEHSLYRLKYDIRHVF